MHSQKVSIAERGVDDSAEQRLSTNVLHSQIVDNQIDIGEIFATDVKKDRTVARSSVEM